MAYYIDSIETNYQKKCSFEELKQLENENESLRNKIRKSSETIDIYNHKYDNILATSKMIAENTTVIIFNYFYLKDQIAYVKSFLDIDKSNNRLKFYSDFLEYLFRNANMNDKIECFEIIAHNEEEKIISIYKALMSLNAIRLLYNCVEFLYYKNEYDKQERCAEPAQKIWLYSI